MVKIGMLIADRYEILERVGMGGMSDVYKGKDHKLNRYVAVKVLKQEFAENANFVSKFRVEAQAAAGLMHPNIVNVYDVGEEKGINYIVMELVEGITLKKYIEKKARLSVKEAVSIAIQVSMGIEAAHNNHVIHRDIKPQNIIISKEGKVKVTDFGIAKAATSNTITSNVMGSVHYTSPEQARGGFSDEKSDIYSLGITLFEMLTGRVPFNGDTTVAIAIKHIQQPMPSPCQFVPEVPYSVEQIVLKCCEKSPDRRYQNIGELIADLKESLIHPDEDFVRRVDPDTEGATRMVVRSDYEEDRYDDGYEEETSRTDYDDYYEREPRRSPEPRNRRESRDVRGNEGRRRSSSSHMVRRKPERYDEDDYEDRDRQSTAGRVITVIAVIAALIIAGVIIYLGGQAFHIWPSAQTQTEETEEEVQVPSVVGLDQDAAQAALTDAGLTPQMEYEESSDTASGIVLRADAEAGSYLKPGTVVTITISAGADGIVVPSVVGLTTAEAKTTLEDKNFKVSIVEASSDTVTPGCVISQTPEGESSAPNGATVTIEVSTGVSTEGKALVPDLSGLTEEEAMARAVEAGLTFGTVTETEVTSASESGKVISQSEEAGSYVEEGSTVDVEIGRIATYSYTADIAGPSAEEDPSYVNGTAVYIVLVAADGTQLLGETVNSFPVHVSFSNLTSSTGTLQMTYINVADATVVTNEETGEQTVVPGAQEQKTITRAVAFTPEN